MHDGTRQKLCELVAEHGRDLEQDRERCARLLRQACPGYAHEAAQLAGAIDQGIPAALRDLPQDARWQDVSWRVLRKLEPHLGLATAIWVVESWALALGRLRRAELTPLPTPGSTGRLVEASQMSRSVVGWFCLGFCWLALGFGLWVVGGVVGWLFHGPAGKAGGGPVGISLTGAVLVVAQRLSRRGENALAFEVALTLTPAMLLAAVLLWSVAGPVALVALVVAGPFALLVALVGTLAGRLFLSFHYLGAPTEALVAIGAGVLGVWVAQVLPGWPGWAAGSALALGVHRSACVALNGWATREELGLVRVMWPEAVSVLLAVVLGGLAGGWGWWLADRAVARAGTSDPGSFYLDLAGGDHAIALALIYLTAGVVLVPLGWLGFRSFSRPRPAPPDRPLTAFIGKAVSVHAIAFRPDGQLLLSGGADGSVRVWDAETAELVSYLDTDVPVVGVGWLSRPWEVLVLGSIEGLRVWDLVRESEVRRGEGLEVVPFTVAVSVGGRLVALGTEASVQVWGVDADRVVHALETPGLALAISADERLLATGGLGGGVSIWDLASGKRVHRLGDRAAPVTALGFTTDGRLLAVAESTLRLWDPASGKALARVEVPAGVESLSVGGSLVALACEDGQVRLWDLDRSTWGESISAAREWEITSVALAPDGRRLAIGYFDGRLELRPLADRPLEPQAG